MIRDEDKDRIVARYSDRFREFGIDRRTLNTGNGEKHRIQHEVHASIGDLRGKTVLDIGCGLAHYYDFLCARDLAVNYIGYDIVPSFIEVNRDRFPEATFEVRDIFTEGIAHSADYVVMCQVFNNRYADSDNDRVVQDAIARALAAARIGVSIDMLTSYVNYEEPHLFYFSPEKMFAFAKSLTPFVRLRHDYLRFDFTLFLYKQGTEV
jgi:SAM-dependent methyltransferase